ncbi:MAG: TIGR01244 family phosphatase [Robiginitomaculum sp.]|nr:MAG: TIGR01244 family phosphatase [Robiginitomaculum sp.]
MSSFNKLSDHISVCGQISPDQVEAIKGAGFKSIICNRPDKEIPLQPRCADVFEVAEQTGLQTVYLPMGMGQLNADIIAAMAEALETLPKPVLAYCGSGKRASILWSFVNAKTQGVDSVLDAAQTAGYDLENLRTALMQFCDE